MTTRLRVLIEIDGEAVVDRDIAVESTNVNIDNGVRQKSPRGINNEWEPTGKHTITIDYQDVLSPVEARPSR